MRRIILASHGELAQGLADTAKMIAGSAAEGVQVCSLQSGGTADTFAKELLTKVLDEPDTEFIILTDLYGASVCTAMTCLVRYPNVKLFTGMNLPMLLAVCLEHTGSLCEESIAEVMKSARAGIRYIDERCLSTENDEF